MRGQTNGRGAVTVAVVFVAMVGALIAYQYTSPGWTAAVFVAQLVITVAALAWQMKTTNYATLVIRWLDRKAGRRG